MYKHTISILSQQLELPDLIKGCIRGNRTYAAALYEHFAPTMFGICLRYANDYHTAEDILQEGFIKVFHHLDRYRFAGSFEGWMKRIFINTAIEYYRRSTKHTGHTEIGEMTQASSSHQVAIEELAQQDLLRLIQQLSPGYRAVFNLYVIEGYSHKEIADLLKISEGTSKSQLARARHLLQKMIITQRDHE